MSQRLYIGKTDKTYYDYVLENTNGALDKLVNEWLALGGPYKIIVGDESLFAQVDPIIADAIWNEAGRLYPESVTIFYANDDQNTLLGFPIEYTQADENSPTVLLTLGTFDDLGKRIETKGLT